MWPHSHSTSKYPHQQCKIKCNPAAAGYCGLGRSVVHLHLKGNLKNLFLQLLEIKCSRSQQQVVTGGGDGEK